MGQDEPKWLKAEERLIFTECAYARIGLAGSFALLMVIRPLRNRYNAGERTQTLYDEIMEVSL
jgi:hypothetical protein